MTALAVALVVAVAGFAVLQLRSLRTPTAKPVGDAHERIRVANVNEYSIFNFIASEKGIFLKHGLDAEVINYDAGRSSVGALLSGQADFAVAGDFVGVTNIFDNSDLRMLAVASNQDVFRMLALKDHGIAVPADLRGKRVGVTRRNASEYYLGQFLTANGLTLDEIIVIDLPPADIAAQLRSGDLDAGVVFEPHAYEAAGDIGANLLNWSAQSQQRAQAVVFTTRQFLADRPDVAVRYVQALAEAESFLRQNDRESREITAEALRYPQPYVDYIWDKIDFELSFKQDILLTLESQARWIIANGLTAATQVPNFLDFMWFEGLAAAKPESITIIH